MAVVAFRLFGSLELGTAQMEQRLTAAGTAIERMTRQQVIATRGIMQMRSGMQSLAFEAAGAAGGIGQFATGALALLSGPAMFAALAGLAALALAFRHVAKAEKEAEAGEAAARQMAGLRIQQMQRFAGALPGTAEAQVTNLGALRQRMAQLQAQQRALELPEMRADTFFTEGRGRQALKNAEASFTQLQTQVDALADRIRRLNDALGRSPLRTALPGMGMQQTTMVPIAPLRGGFQPGRMPLATGTTGGLDPANLTAFTAIGEQLQAAAAAERLRVESLGILANAEQRAALVALSSAGAVLEFEKSLQKTQTSAVQTATVLISAFSSVIAGLVSGGGPGGVLSGIGGILSIAGTIGKGIPGLQVAGAIVGGFGSIITAAEARREQAEERRHSETLAAMRERPPVFIYQTDVSDSGMAREAVRWNRYISRGGKGPTGPDRGHGGLSRP